ncbi:MAG: hypothetical protein ACFB5Z_06730 [Elainellaceae cyanobacterium]
MLLRAAALATLLAQLPVAEPNSAEVTLQLYVLQVTPNAGLDLPPLDQQPAVYADLTLGNQQRTTPAIAPERIGDSVYPNWGLSARQRSPRLESGYPTQVIVQVFDQDSELEDIIDDKVVQTAIQFDPFACAASINAYDLAGRWQDDVTCVLPIDTIESDRGTMGIVLAARWANAAPGVRQRPEAEADDSP